MTAAAAMKKREPAAAGALRVLAALAFVMMASPPAWEVSAGKKEGPGSEAYLVLPKTES